jgi:Flp pilus assembly protein TadG
MSKKNKNRGTIFMELCVSLAVLSIILLFIANAGLAFNEWNVISFAAREGARYGAITHSEANAISRSESLIKSNKGMSQNESLNRQKYTITAKREYGNMTVTIQWRGGGFSLRSTKTFRLGS